MAANTGGKKSAKKADLIDPIYQKFTKSVIRALGSTEFYEFFMDAIAHSDNEFQFSNRRMEKVVDITWIDAVEDALEGFQKIIATPRNVIKEEELIVNVANAKRAGADVVRHLAMHASLVEKYDSDTGDVRPSKLMQKYREDSIGLYENRLVFTVLEQSYQFVKIRHDALFEAMGDEFGAKLKLRSDMESATEHVHMDMFLHIRDVDSAMDTDEKNSDVFNRISRLYRILSVHMNSQFAQQMAKLPRVKGNVVKTNVLKKNPNYHAITKLWDFLHSYDDIGYTIRVVEQNPQINETFERDIYHNILFNYLILKGYLEREQDRQLPAPLKEKKRTLKPKFIKEIIEELTEDYDLPDVEVRKVLIEELTKQQLMQEEAAERRRLVEEQAQRKKEEAERIRQEKAAERERLRREREAERERIRQEKAAEEERLRLERMLREQEERRRSKLFKKEIAHFREGLEKQLQRREAEAAKRASAQQDFADAAQLIEEAEQRKLEAAERRRQRRREEQERQKLERRLARERALREEQERQEAARREQEEREEAVRREQLARDMEVVQIYRAEADYFFRTLDTRRNLRVQHANEEQREREERERLRQQRLAARAAGRS